MFARRKPNYSILINAVGCCCATTHKSRHATTAWTRSPTSAQVMFIRMFSFNNKL